MRVGIITGASSGIGREFALQIAGGDYCDELWLIARNEAELQITADRADLPCRCLPLDLEVTAQYEALQALLQQEKPLVSMVVNGAGFGKNGLFSEIDRSEQLAMIDLNCRAVVGVTQAVLPYMHRGSALITISSLAGFAPLASFGIYSATKAFASSLSVAIKAELAPRGIAVLTVTPGSVETNFHARSRGVSGRKKKLFSKKASAGDVVSQALVDLELRSTFSLFGIGSKIAFLLSKLLSPLATARFAQHKIYPKK